MQWVLYSYFICNLSNLNCVTWIVWIISEQWIKKYVEGNDLGLIEGITPSYALRYLGKQRKSSVGMGRLEDRKRELSGT